MCNKVVIWKLLLEGLFNTTETIFNKRNLEKIFNIYKQFFPIIEIKR